MDFSDLGMIDLSNLTSIEMWRTIFAPFALVFIILWAVLDRMKLFGKGTNIVISLSLSLMLATTESFLIMSQYITETSGNVMIMVFGVLLIGGTGFWALKRGSEIYVEQDADKHIKSIMKKINKLRGAYKRNRDPGILDRIEELEREIKRIQQEERSR